MFRSIHMLSNPLLPLIAILRISFGGVAYDYGRSLNHIHLSHHIWSSVLCELPGITPITIIDATCGNGYDSLEFSKLLHLDNPQNQSKNKLYCIDIQTVAIENTKQLLQHHNYLPNNSIIFKCQSHEEFPIEIQPSSVAIISYNLGYLPGIDRKNGSEIIKTTTETTLKSISNGLSLLRDGGIMSVLAYTGHDGGMEEKVAVESLFSKLDNQDWRVYSHVPLNRKQSPTLFNVFRINKYKNNKN
eukprot:gene15340-20671_t